MGEGGSKSDEIKGRVKEAAGSLLDDDDLKKEGRAELAAGKAKKKAEEIIDAVKDRITGSEKREKS